MQLGGSRRPAPARNYYKCRINNATFILGAPALWPRDRAGKKIGPGNAGALCRSVLFRSIRYEAIAL